MKKDQPEAKEQPVFKIFKLIHTRLALAESNEENCYFIQEQDAYPISGLGYQSQLEAQIAIRDHSDKLGYGDFVVLPVFQIRHKF